LKIVRINAPSDFNNGKFDDPVKFPILETKLSTNFEIFSRDEGDYYMKALTGWFKAPTDGLYRFFMACDDWCQLLLDSTNPFVSGQTTTPNPVLIAERKGSTYWRNYFYENRVGD
jgi:hypothetical protein